MEEKMCAGFFFEVDGEHIVEARPHLDYTCHRGVEELVETKTPEESLYLVYRTCRASPFSQQLCLTQGIEELARIEVPPRAKFIRTIISEFERIYEHILWVGTIGHEVGHTSIQAQISRDQSLIRKLFESLFDLREGRCMINIIGGVNQDISCTPSKVEKISKELEVIEDRLALDEDILLEEENAGVRFKEVGVLETEKGNALGAVGPLARASGLQRDVRKDDPYVAYIFDTIDFDLAISEYGDVLARILVIFQETYESIHIIRAALENLPKGEIHVSNPEWGGFGEMLSRTEASQGELLHYLRITSNKMERLKVRPPATANLASLLEILTNDCYIADIPVVIASVDPNFFYTDQITLNESPTGRTHVYNREELRNYGIKWYKQKML